MTLDMVGRVRTGVQDRVVLGLRGLKIPLTGFCSGYGIRLIAMIDREIMPWQSVTIGPKNHLSGTLSFE